MATAERTRCSGPCILHYTAPACAESLWSRILNEIQSHHIASNRAYAWADVQSQATVSPAFLYTLRPMLSILEIRTRTVLIIWNENRFCDG